MSMSKLPVTVVIPVRNEESNLPRCLSRLERFAEIIVVDSSSVDRTPDIARKVGARYINFVWDGRYPKKRNWLLLNHSLENEWVLFLDADELVNEAFCDKLTAALSDQDYEGYWLNYNNWFLGKRLRHGLRQRKLALFRVGAGLYERVEEELWSKLDMEIHEHPIIDGNVGNISVAIEHNDYRGIARFVERHLDYALWEAMRVKELQCNFGAIDNLTARQRFKYKYILKWWYPCFYFVAQYFGKFGFLDGGPGFQYAFFKAWYFNVIRLLAREREEAGQGEPH